jgi:hypothetical protein
VALTSFVVLWTVLLGAAGVCRADYDPSDRDQQAPPPVQPGEGMPIGRFIFSPSVTFGTEYDTNIYSIESGFQFTLPDGTVVDLAPQSDTVSIARARLALKLPFSHSYASLVWIPQYRQYGQADSALTTSNTVSFDSRLNFSSGVSVSAQDTLLLGFVDVSTINSDGTPLFVSTPYTRNNPEVQVDWPLGNGWGFTGDWEQQDYVFEATKTGALITQSPGSSSGSRGLFDFFDYVTNVIKVGAFREMGRYRLYGTLDVGRTDQDRTNYANSHCDLSLPDALLSDYCKELKAVPQERIEQKDAMMGVRGKLFANADGVFEAGVTTWKFLYGNTAPYTGISLSGRIAYTMNRMTTATLAVEHLPTQASGQYTGYYLTTRATLGIEHKFTMSLSGRAGLMYMLTEFPDPKNGWVYREYFGDFEAIYRPGHASSAGPFEVILSYRPEVTRTSLVGRNVNGQRLGLSFQYGWF